MVFFYEVGIPYPLRCHLSNIDMQLVPLFCTRFNLDCSFLTTLAAWPALALHHSSTSNIQIDRPLIYFFFSFFFIDTMTPERVETSDGDSGYSDASLNSAPARQSYIAGRRSRISRTKPNCNKCKNHKEVKALSGHKRYCPYQHCSCELCLLTDERRRVMAAQTRQKRAQVRNYIQAWFIF